MLTCTLFQTFPGGFQWPLPATTPLSHQWSNTVQQRPQLQSKWYAASEETFEGRLKGELRLGEIEVELDRHNYKLKFHNLICWEERAHIERLTEK